MDEAQQKIEEWINANDVELSLDLSDLSLTELPILPRNLQILDCHEKLFN
jgi:hypothetical protein